MPLRESFVFDHFRRVHSCHLPNSPGNAAEDDEGGGAEDAGINPPGDGGLLHIVVEPMAHDDIAHGESDGAGDDQLPEIFFGKDAVDVPALGTVHLADGDFLLATLTAQ